MSTHPEPDPAAKTATTSIEALYEGDEISIDQCPPTEEEVGEFRRLVAYFHPY